MKYIGVFLLMVNLSFAQHLSSSLDKEKIDLGESVTMKITIRDLQGKEVTSAQKNALLPFHFEESSDEVVQSSEKYTRIIVFSIFDEGKFTIPALEFRVGDSILRTLPYEIEVINPVHKNEEISDIMPNEEVSLGLSDYWEIYQNYVFGVLGILGVVLIWTMLNKTAKKEPQEPNSREDIVKLLEQLQSKNYIEADEYRRFYIELLDISRLFLSQKYQIPADILLTDDLLEMLRETNTVSLENQKMLKEVFSRGDLAKFAKTIPHKEIMENDFRNIKNWVKSSL